MSLRDSILSLQASYGEGRDSVGDEVCSLELQVVEEAEHPGGD